MPHQCVRCSKMYDDGAQEILKGCSCGAKLFYFVRKELLAKIKKESPVANMNTVDREKIEQDIYAIIGDEVDKNLPVILDIESVKVLKPGSFELDLVNLFNNKQPLVYRLEEGKYVIDLNHSLGKSQRTPKKRK